MSNADRKQQKLDALRSDALALARAGKHAAALDRFAKLESLDESEADWPRRAAECHQALGNETERLAALCRAADCYVRAGMLVKAMAMCRQVLASDPRHPAALNWMSQLESPAARQQQGKATIPLGQPAAPRALEAPFAPAPAVPAEASTAAQKLVAERGLVAVARKVALRAKPEPPASPALPTHLAPPAKLVPEPPPAKLAPEPPPAKLVPEPPPAKLAPEPPPAKPSHAKPPPAKLVPEPPSPASSPPMSSGDWEAVDDFEVITSEVPGAPDAASASEPPSPVSDSELLIAEPSAPLLSLPPLSVAPERLRSLVPGSVALPGGTGTPSGMFRLAIDGAALAREETLRQAREVLPAVPLFSELDPSALEGLTRHSRLLHVRDGDLVFKQGDPPESLYVVVTGQLAVFDEAASALPLYQLGDNDFFGESGLISNEPQSVTVRASEDSDLLAFDREAMQSCISDNPAVVPLLLRFVRERMLEHLMHVSPLFTGFDAAERRALARRFEFIEFDRGSQLIQQGQRSPGLFVLLSGAVEVMLSLATQAHRLATLERADVFGEMSLLGRPAAVADVRGVRPGFTLLLPAASFREVIMTHPQFLEVVTALCEERREANARVLATLT